MIGVGLVTYNRPDYFAQSALSVKEKLLPIIDKFFVYNDHSLGRWLDKYQATYDKLKDPKVTITQGIMNSGVGKAKNNLFNSMLDAGCDYMFIMEDDVVIDSPKAVTAYIELSQETGLEHFNFAHHGHLNPVRVGASGNMEFYPNCVGAWSFYTRNTLEQCGLIDEKFHNCWDHVEHTSRIARAGLTTPFWEFADHKDSSEFIHEIPGSDIDTTIIRSPRWNSRVQEGLRYWKKKDGIGLPPQK